MITESKKDIGPTPHCKGKQLQFLLEENNDLKNFTMQYYQRLIQANPERETHDRSKKDEIFDIMARLTVGVEVCIAFGFVGNKLVVGTNKAKHSTQILKYFCQFKVEKQADETALLIPVVVVRFGDKTFTRSEKPIKVNYNNISNMVTLKPEDQKWKVDILPSEHHFEGQGILTFELGLKNTFRVEPRPLEIQRHIAEDPVLRRIQFVLEHLQCALLLRQYNMRKNRSVSDNKIENFWLNSIKKIFKFFLSDRAAEWCSNRNFSEALKTNELHIFCEDLFDDFNSHKNLKAATELSLELIDDWKKGLREKILSHKIRAPIEMWRNPNEYIRRSVKFLIEIKELDDIIINMQGEDPNDIFIQFLAIYFDLKGCSYPVEIIENLREDVHAEMKVFQKTWLSSQQKPYLGITKLCCVTCKTVLEAHKVSKDKYCGNHGILFPWTLSEIFYKDSIFMKTFLGIELFKIYEDFTDKVAKFDGKTYQKKQLVHMIIESISMLDEPTRKKWYQESKLSPDYISFREASDQFPQGKDEKKNSILQDDTKKPTHTIIESPHVDLIHSLCTADPTLNYEELLLKYQAILKQNLPAYSNQIKNYLIMAILAGSIEFKESTKLLKDPLAKADEVIEHILKLIDEVLLKQFLESVDMITRPEFGIQFDILCSICQITIKFVRKISNNLVELVEYFKVKGQESLREVEIEFDVKKKSYKAIKKEN
jgi:hypothetical protein